MHSRPCSHPLDWCNVLAAFLTVQDKLAGSPHPPEGNSHIGLHQKAESMGEIPPLYTRSPVIV